MVTYKITKQNDIQRRHEISISILYLKMGRTQAIKRLLTATHDIPFFTPLSHAMIPDALFAFSSAVSMYSHR